MGESQQAEHPVATEVQLGRPRRAPELSCQGGLARGGDGHAHESHHEDGADPQGEGGVEGAHGAAVVGHGVHRVALKVRRSGEELGDGGRVVADDAAYFVDVAGVQGVLQVVAGLGELAFRRAQRFGGLAQRRLGGGEVCGQRIGAVAQAFRRVLQRVGQGFGVGTHLLQAVGQRGQLALQLIVVGAHRITQSCPRLVDAVGHLGVLLVDGCRVRANGVLGGVEVRLQGIQLGDDAVKGANGGA